MSDAATGSSFSNVIIVGSINVDLVASVPHRAAAGETVLASELVRLAGGKGANQAAASARAGAPTRLIAAVGNDADGAQQRATLRDEGVDVTDVRTISGAATGTAFISVTPDGENSITVVAGANSALTSETVIPLLRATPDGALVVLQTEVTPQLITDIAHWCRNKDVRYVLNNGPFVSLPRPVLAGANPLVMNEHEARMLCDGAGVETTADSLARGALKASGAHAVVVTMGADGIQLATGAVDTIIPATSARSVVDTTGAGDAFLGTMAAALSSGQSLPQSVRAASIAAAESVSWHGARPPKP